MAVALLGVGCVRKWPVYYAPVWSADGSKLYYAVYRPDGGLAVREVDVASRKGTELTVSRFTTPPAAVALSPRGDKVACAAIARDEGQPPMLRLHLLSPAGNADRVAWEAPCARGVADLCWMPDGRSLLVAADRPGGSALFRVPADGGAAQAVAADLCDVRGPTASPDGQRVAFVAREKPGEPWSLYVASADGGSRKVAAPALFHEFRLGYGPAWAPRGGAVAYVGERYLCPGRSEILLWEPGDAGRSSLAAARPTAATSSRLLARNLAGGCIAPAWSPGGDAVAFVSLPLGVAAEGPGTRLPAMGAPADILVVDAAGKGTLTVTADGLANLMPSWSPDGRQVAFGTCGEPGAEPHVVQIASVESGVVRLAESGPEAQFLLALARHRRSGSPALAALATLASRVGEEGMASFVARVLADLFAAKGDWENAAQWARKAAEAPDAAERLRGLKLLAQAQMRLGDPLGALATADAALARSPDEETRALRESLRQGVETAQRLEAELKETPSPVLLQALADTHLRQLGCPRKARELLLRLARDFPRGTHLRTAAESLFACAALPDASRVSYRVLEWGGEQIGADALTPLQRLLLAEAAAAQGDARAALRCLGPLSRGAVPDELRERVALALVGVGDSFAAGGGARDALAAYRSALSLASDGAAARARVEAAKLLARDGEHWEATRLLLEALAPKAPATVQREALRLLTAGRLQRRDPVAYDVAEVVQLAAFGFLDAAIAQGEQLEHLVALNPGRRAVLRRALGEAFDALVACHVARGDEAAVRQALARWLRRASRADDLSRALAQLAALYRRTGDRKGLVEVLSRLAADFPDRPEGVQARRELLLLDTRGGPGP